MNLDLIILMPVLVYAIPATLFGLCVLGVCAWKGFKEWKKK